MLRFPLVTLIFCSFFILNCGAKTTIPVENSGTSATSKPNSANGTVSAGTDANVSVKVGTDPSVCDLICLSKRPHIGRIVSGEGKLALIATQGVFLSLDGGKTFTLKRDESGLPKPGVFTYLDGVIQNGLIGIATHKGYFVSKDNGTKFTEAAITIKGKPLTSKIFYRALYASGTTFLWAEQNLISSSNGENFDYVVSGPLKTGGTALTYEMDVLNGKIILAENVENKIYSRDIADKTTNTIKDLGTDFQKLGGILSMVVGNGKIFVGTSKGIHVSSDNGTTFKAADMKLPAGASTFINDLHYKDNTLYAVFGNAAGIGSGSGGIAVSKNDGGSFTSVVLDTNGSNKMGGERWPLTVHVDSGLVYAGCMGGFLVSKDGGNTFDKVTLPAVP